MRALVATSLAPRLAPGEDGGDAIQSMCVRSLHDAFGAVAAFNYAEEVAGVPTAAPFARVVDLGPRAGSPFRRPLVDLGVVMRHLAGTGETLFALANSDAYVALDAGEVADVLRVARDGVVVFQRHETGNLACGHGPAYTQGYDVVVFGRPALEAVTLDGLAFGMPWWDYALPVMALSAGLPLYRGRPGAVRHASHDPRWSRELWRDGLAAYMANLSRQNARLGAPPLLRAMADVTGMLARTHAIAPLYGGEQIYEFGTMFALFNVAAIERAATPM
ncbi:hypothetical protein [Acuticoccus sp.]|uniref:hypothetical protein n=1 Tax=Acuticoccus sp. TaxID=1904378 RepID=UPI003B52B330